LTGKSLKITAKLAQQDPAETKEEKLGARQQTTENHPQNEQRMQEKDGSREYRIEVIRNEGCMHIWNLQERGLTIDLTPIHSALPE
jgi:hypothetical protein